MKCINESETKQTDWKELLKMNVEKNFLKN